MSETPRTWTLEMSPSGCDGEDFHVQALGPDVGWDEKPEVIENALVDAERERLKSVLLGERDPENPGSLAFQVRAISAERERLLDLLEKAYRLLDVCESIPLGGRALWLELKNQLREYGRLGDRGPGA